MGFSRGFANITALRRIEDKLGLAGIDILDTRRVVEVSLIRKTRESIAALKLIFLDRIDLAVDADHEIIVIGDEHVNVAFQSSDVDLRIDREHVCKLNNT